MEEIETAMGKRETPTFVTEIPLVVSTEQERVLLARLEAGRQVYNACLGEGLRRREALCHSRAYRAALAMKPGEERSKAFAEARKAAGFREFDLHAYGKQFGQSWLGEHLDALVVQ